MKKNIYTTAIIVTGLSILERSLGFIYRVVLSHLIGSEGLGIYQVALSIFGVFATLGTGGIPITVSRLISKSKADNLNKNEYSAVTAGILASLMLTLPIYIIYYPFKDSFNFLFSDTRCNPVFSILLSGLVLTCVYAVIRGSFWGNKNFLLPSIIEISEEAVMVISGIILLKIMPNSNEGAIYAAIAVVISYVFSLITSLICYFIKKGKFVSPKEQLQPLFSSAMPITAVKAGNSLINSAVAIIFPAMLIKTGLTGSEAIKLFGIVSGMVIPVLSIPSTIIGSISLVLVPELSEDFYRKKYKQLKSNIQKSIYITVLIACAIIPLFIVLGEIMGQLLYANLKAGEMIKNCSLMLVPMSLTMITTGILNSLNYEKQTLSFYFISATSLIFSILVLPKYIGIYSYPVGLISNYIICAILNIFFIIKKYSLSKILTVKSIIAFLLMFPISFLGKLIYSIIIKNFSSITTIILTGISILIITIICYFLLKLFDESLFKCNNNKKRKKLHSSLDIK